MTALALAIGAASAQPTGTRLSGVAFLDYAYTASDDDLGARSLGDRRLSQPADSDIRDDLRVRRRRDAQGSSATASGTPAPFAGDAWVGSPRASRAHRAPGGVQPLLVFQSSEPARDYRSPECVLIDRLQSGRDLGLREPVAMENGPRYAALTGSGRGFRPEPSLRLRPGGEWARHVWGRQANATGALRASGAGSVARVPFGADPDREPRRGTGTAGAGTAGTVAERCCVGVEGLSTQTDVDRGAVQARDRFGVSVVGSAGATSRAGALARDHDSDDDAIQTGLGAHLVIAVQPRSCRSCPTCGRGEKARTLPSWRFAAAVWCHSTPR